MKIKIKEMIPESWIRAETSDSVTVWFSASRGNYNRKPFTFPKELIIDAPFAEAIGMFLGDGDIHRKEKNHTSYASKDLDIISLLLDIWRERLLLDSKNITFFINHGSIKPDTHSIAKSLKVPVSRLKTRLTDRNKYPAIHMQVNGRIFRLVFERIIFQFINSEFLKSGELRRGFLRGIFAAEGCVGINHIEHFINSITFTLADHEKDTVSLIHKALAIEEISFKLVERKSCRETIISNWKNYLKCWEIGLFDCCARKKQAFLSIANTSKISARVPQEDLDNLAMDYNQGKLAAILNSHQGNVSRLLRGQFLLNRHQIKQLEALGYTFTIKSLRIGNLTDLPYNNTTKELFVI